MWSFGPSAFSSLSLGSVFAELGLEVAGGTIAEFEDALDVGASPPDPDGLLQPDTTNAPSTHPPMTIFRMEHPFCGGILANLCKRKPRSRAHSSSAPNCA
jgi:hypothetical protein